MINTNDEVNYFSMKTEEKKYTHESKISHESGGPTMVELEDEGDDNLRITTAESDPVKNLFKRRGKNNNHSKTLPP
jgi:hypothetical protein